MDLCFCAKNNGKNISKNLSGKCSQKLIDNTKKTAPNRLTIL